MGLLQGPRWAAPVCLAQLQALQALKLLSEDYFGVMPLKHSAFWGSSRAGAVGITGNCRSLGQRCPRGLVSWRTLHHDRHETPEEP